ncbi:MAG: PAS domain-containing protein [Deltaproteobacteria bacterium]|nr:PAS domain-containing protein [Deltaproteobacteria bacterium]
MQKRKRLLWQLYPSYLLITLVSLIAATWFASKTMQQFIFEHNASDLKSLARLFEQQILEHFSPLNETAIDRLCKEISERSEFRVTVILPTGKVVGDSEEDPEKMDNHMDRPEVMQAIRGEVSLSTRYSLTLRKNMMYVGVPIKSHSDIIGVLRSSSPMTSIDGTIKRIQIKIWIGGVFIAIFAAVISLIICRRISLPIEEIRKGAERFTRGDFQYRLPVYESEEIGSLSETMNQMANELNERINTITRHRNELEAVFSSMVEGVLAVDTDECIISMNHAASRFFECESKEIQGRSIQEVIRNTELQKFVRSVLSGKKQIEKDIVLFSGTERVVNAHGTALHDAAGDSIGALIVLNDVTQLRKLETIRRDFVANVSHEIKTPITAIKGFVETLRDGATKTPEQTERFLEIIDKHAKRLEAVIEDLLNLSRIEQNSEKNIDLSETIVADVLENSVQLCRDKANAKKIGIEISCHDDISVKMEPRLFEQALVNLLDNAIKYSDEGSDILLTATQSEHEVVIGVRDHGCGIEKKHITRLFERFYRVDKARSRKLGGTGLGLSIVKHIAQAHGGKVSVESSPEMGSTFKIHLPTM